MKEGVKPAALSTEYINSLKRIVEHPELNVESFEPNATICPGEEILVREGPLAGFSGRVVELRGSRRLLVWINSIGRGLLCTLGDHAVIRVPGSAA